MSGYELLFGFLFSGLCAGDALFRERGIITRVWLGLSMGFVMMMWFPSLFAFAMGFTRAANAWALGLAGLIAVISLARQWILKKPERNHTHSDPPTTLTLCLLIPVMAFVAYLLYTHTLREVDGALHVGQSTFGDLNLHLGIATGLRDAKFPPDYTLLWGASLGYPFLVDALSASMLLYGTPLAMSFVVPSVLMIGLVFLGFILLSWEMTHDARAVAVAYVLLVFNGGLGFLYTFDFFPSNPEKFWAALHDFYATPTNMPSLNLRWSNVISDMLIPQRTLMAGWMMGIPALWLMWQAQKDMNWRHFAMLGLWAGAMPMVHTHTFLAIGLFSGGVMIYALFRKQNMPRKEILKCFLLYGGIALAVALPQLMKWTFPQTLGGGSLRFQFNWVNNSGNQGLIDGYLWFWIKNVGPVFLMIPPAVLKSKRSAKAMAVGALAIFVVAELILFQPNEYDNNKLFYIAFLIILPIVAKYMTDLFDRLKGFNGRWLFAALTLLICVASGAMTLAREAVSDYQLYGADEARAATYIDENAPRDAVFVTGTQHVNLVSTLAGRQILCGTGSFLYYHGLSYEQQQWDARAMYEDPYEFWPLFEEYGVDFMMVSSYERGEFQMDESLFEVLWPVWYRDGSVTIYAISDRVRD